MNAYLYLELVNKLHAMWYILYFNSLELYLLFIRTHILAFLDKVVIYTLFNNGVIVFYSDIHLNSKQKLKFVRNFNTPTFLISYYNLNFWLWWHFYFKTDNHLFSFLYFLVFNLINHFTLSLIRLFSFCKLLALFCHFHPFLTWN